MRQRVPFLTPRERKVAESIMVGGSRRLIAEELNVSQDEISRLWSEVCQTLGVESAKGLSLLAAHKQTSIIPGKGGHGDDAA